MHNTGFPDKHLRQSRRDNLRYIVQIRAQYFIQKKSLRYQDCTIVNISNTGAAVILPEAPDSGDTILLEFLVPPGFEQIHLRGKVARLEQNTYGIKFSQRLDDNLLAKLRSPAL